MSVILLCPSPDNQSHFLFYETVLGLHFCSLQQALRISNEEASRSCSAFCIEPLHVLYVAASITCDLVPTLLDKFPTLLMLKHAEVIPVHVDSNLAISLLKILTLIPDNAGMYE